MAIDVNSTYVAVRGMAELVRPVRALLKQNKKIEAIKLVRELTDRGLKESKEFVDHVQARPGARALRVAELWIDIASRESIGNKPESEPRPTPTSKEESMSAHESGDTQAVSLADWYAGYMQTHTYAEWEQLLETCLAANKREQEL